MNHQHKNGVKAVRLALALLAGGTVFSAYAQQPAGTVAPVAKEQAVDATAPAQVGDVPQTVTADAPVAAPQASDGVAKVMITGSNIRSIAGETASPVQMIKHEDIVRQGVTNVAELIGNLAASTGGLSDGGGNGTFAPGASNVSLRNLGAQSTLVLVNGRRIATYGFANFTEVFSNVDSIPLDAVDHVEVLKSGASAIYGSDAVAGVINIITKQNFQGVEVNADAQRSLQSKTFGTKKASITAGFGDYNEDGYNILVNADLFKRDNVMWTNLLRYTNPELTATSASFGKYSTYSTPGNIIDGSLSQPVAGCRQDLIIGGFCKYNRYERFQASPESQRGNLFLSGTFNLGDGTQAFAELSLSKSMTRYISPFLTYGDGIQPVVWGNPSTGASQKFTYLGLNSQSPLNPTALNPTVPADDGVAFRYRFTDAPTYNNVDGTQFRALGGVRGNVGEFEWEAATGVMGSSVTSNQQGAFSSSGFKQEVGDYTQSHPDLLYPYVNQQLVANDRLFFAQPFGYHPGQPNSAQVINTLFPVFTNTGDTQAEFIDAKITGPLYKLPAGMMSFAMGGEIKHENIILDASKNIQTGDIVGYGISTADSGRSIESLYSEVLIPVVKDFEVTAALRVDKYPNLTGHVSPKLAMMYSLSDSVKFRGTLEHGFRAPNLIESANSKKYSFDSNVADPLRCAQATQLSNDLNNKSIADTDPKQSSLDAARAQAVSAAECAASPQDQVGFNPELKPETSKSYSYGLLFEPIKGYSTTIDYWHIVRSNTIGLQSTAQLLNEAIAGNVPAGSTVNRAAFDPKNDPTFLPSEIIQYGVTAGQLQGIVRSMQNISEQKTSGIDIAFNSVTKLDDWGQFRTNLDATYNLSYYDTSVSSSPENLVGQYGMPNLLASFTMTWDYDGFANSLRYNYGAGYVLQAGQDDVNYSPSGCESINIPASKCHVASSRTTDYTLVYTGFKNVLFAMNIANLFQQRSPTDFRAFGVNGVIPSSGQDAAGRMLNLSVNYKFY